MAPLCILKDIGKSFPEYENNTTLFHKVVESGWYESCKLIIGKVEDKNPADNEGRTPLHLAAKNGYKELAELIIDFSINKNPKNKKGWTPLHYAAENGHALICKLIMEKLEKESTKCQEENSLASSQENSELCIMSQDIQVDKCPRTNLGKDIVIHLDTLLLIFHFSNAFKEWL